MRKSSPRTGVFQDDIWELDSSGSGQFFDSTTVDCIILACRETVIDIVHVTS